MWRDRAYAIEHGAQSMFHDGTFSHARAFLDCAGLSWIRRGHMRSCGNPSIVLGTILVFLSTQVHASSNVGREPSEQEVFAACPALEGGMAQRLPDAYPALQARFNDTVGRLAGRPGANDLTRRLEYSQCSWLRHVATRCLEPTNRGPRMYSPVDRLAENVAMGKVWEDLEDDCMRELVKSRDLVLGKLGDAASRDSLSTAVAALVPPLRLFGTYKGPAHRECRVGDPQTWALDPHFDDWVDCSQWQDELHLSTSLEDSLSGIDVWLGAPMNDGVEHTLSASTSYDPTSSSLEARDDAATCALALTLKADAVEVRPLDAQTKCVPAADDEQPQITALQRFQRAAPEPPPLRELPPGDVRTFQSGGRLGRSWLDTNAGVAVGWVLGLNRSLQVSSNCANLPAYDELVDFFDRYRAAVVARDITSLTRLTAFPLQLNSAATEFVGDAAQLQARFDSVFPPPLFAVVRDTDAHFVYCAQGHVMIAAGRVWAKPGASGALQVYFVDSHAQPRSKPKDIVPN
jgi:hypothetical protein